MDYLNYDPVGPEIIEDPIPAYSDLREMCPVHYHEGLENPIYSFSRYADVQSVLLDQEIWSNQYGPGISYDKNIGDLQRYDPPEHQIRRKFLRSEFLPRTIAKSEKAIQNLAHELIDSFYELGKVELHDEYALPLPVKAFTELMGISDEDAGDFKTWADELTLGMTYPSRSKKARKELVAYTTGQVRKRREAVKSSPLIDGQDPIGTIVPEGLISHLSCHPLEDGEYMPDEEVASMIGQLLVAGHETTTSLITNALWRLLLNPKEMALLRSDMSLIPNAIEESLRFDPPVLGLCKTNKLSVKYHEVEIPMDSKVMILYASANRDETVFSDPDVFRIERPLLESKRHLSFGWGPHFCLGAHLARLVGQLAVKTLLERIDDFNLDEPTERISPPFLWGRKTLKISWQQ